MTAKALHKLLAAVPVKGFALAADLPSRHVREAYVMGLVSIVHEPGERGARISLTPEGIRARRNHT